MRAIRDVADKSMQWICVSFPIVDWRGEWELRAGEELVATLRWPGKFGTLAVSETAGAAWTFKESGDWREWVTVRVFETDNNVAVFKPGWLFGGTGHLSNYRSYRWMILSFWRFWRREWAWADEMREPLIRFSETDKITAGFRLVEVSVAPLAIMNPDLPLLTVLGWYLWRRRIATWEAAATGV